MLTIDLKELGKNAGSAVEYLRSRLDEQVTVKRSKVNLGNTNPRRARLLLRKFLRQLRLEGYRVVAVNPGLIEVRATEKEKRQPVRNVEGDKPSAWETIPDLWYTTPPGIIRPAKRSKREQKRTMRGLSHRR